MNQRNKDKKNWCPVLEKQVKQKNYLQRISVSFEKFDDDELNKQFQPKYTTIQPTAEMILFLFFFLIQEFDSTLPL